MWRQAGSWAREWRKQKLTLWGSRKDFDEVAVARRSMNVPRGRGRLNANDNASLDVGTAREDGQPDLENVEPDLPLAVKHLLVARGRGEGKG